MLQCLQATSVAPGMDSTPRGREQLGGVWSTGSGCGNSIPALQTEAKVVQSQQSAGPWVADEEVIAAQQNGITSKISGQRGEGKTPATPRPSYKLQKWLLDPGASGAFGERYANPT